MCGIILNMRDNTLREPLNFSVIEKINTDATAEPIWSELPTLTVAPGEVVRFLFRDYIYNVGDLEYIVDGDENETGELLYVVPNAAGTFISLVIRAIDAETRVYKEATLTLMVE